MSISDLPSELLRLVLSFTVDPISHNKSNYQNLLRSSLVCRRWRLHSQSLLRTTSLLRRREDLRLWRASLQGSVSPTRTLEITCDTHNPSAVKGATVKKAVQSCSGLSHLVLERVTFLPLETLSIAVASDLQSLRLLDQVHIEPPSDEQPPRDMGFSFTHLHLSHFKFELTTLSALLHPSLTSLDLAHALSQVPSVALPPHIVPLLLPLAPNLKFVSTPEGPEFIKALLPFLSSLTSLEHYSSSSVSSLVLESIPSDHLTTWTIHISHEGRDIPGILAVVSSAKVVRNLKRIRLGAWNRVNATRHPVRVALMRRCEVLGIEIQFKEDMEEDLRCVAPWEHGR